MIDFEYFIKSGEVKKCSPNHELAKSLIKDMKERIEKSFLLDIEIFPKLVFENVYDALQDFCNALLTLDGFKSYSHVASIAYLKKFGFSEYEINLLDKFRLRRHGSKYYGAEVSFEEAEEIFDFYNKIKSKIEEILSERGLR